MNVSVYYIFWLMLFSFSAYFSRCVPMYLHCIVYHYVDCHHSHFLFIKQTQTQINLRGHQVHAYYISIDRALQVFSG